MSNSCCRWCGSNAHGACLSAPHGRHEHIADAKTCEFCGGTNYGDCSLSPFKKHRHGHDGKSCRWCGSNVSNGTGCLSPHGRHER